MGVKRELGDFSSVRLLRMFFFLECQNHLSAIAQNEIINRFGNKWAK